MKFMESITLMTAIKNAVLLKGQQKVHVTLDSSVEGELEGIIWFTLHYENFFMFY